MPRATPSTLPRPRAMARTKPKPMAVSSPHREESALGCVSNSPTSTRSSEAQRQRRSRRRLQPLFPPPHRHRATPRRVYRPWLMLQMSATPARRPLGPRRPKSTTTTSLCPCPDDAHQHHKHIPSYRDGWQPLRGPPRPSRKTAVRGLGPSRFPRALRATPRPRNGLTQQVVTPSVGGSFLDTPTSFRGMVATASTTKTTGAPKRSRKAHGIAVTRTRRAPRE